MEKNSVPTNFERLHQDLVSDRSAESKPYRETKFIFPYCRDEFLELTLQEVQEFLSQKKSFLASYRYEDFLISDLICQASIQEKIDPRFLLTVLEIDYGLVKKRNAVSKEFLDLLGKNMNIRNFKEFLFRVAQIIGQRQNHDEPQDIDAGFKKYADKTFQYPSFFKYILWWKSQWPELN